MMQTTNEIATFITRSATDDNQHDADLLPSGTNTTHDAAALDGTASSDAKSGAKPTHPPLKSADVVAFRSQLAHVLYTPNVHDAIRSYSAHMKTRPSTLKKDLHRFEPVAAILDEALTLTCGMVGKAVTPYIEKAVAGATPEGLEELMPKLLEKLAREFEKPVLDACRKAFADEGGSSSLATESSTTSSDDAAPAARASQDAPSSPVAPAAPSQSEDGDDFDLLAHTACGQTGFAEERIAQIRRSDTRRNGKPFVRFFTGARLRPNAVSGEMESDEGEAAHKAADAYMRVEASRLGVSIDECRRRMVANVDGREAVIGKDGLVNNKGEVRRYSRSFCMSLVRHEKHGAVLRPEDYLDAQAGPIGDEFSLEEVDGLLEDVRVCPELKDLLRLCDVMLVDSELKEAELILGFHQTSVRRVKPVGKAVAAVEQTPRTRGLAGGYHRKTYDYPSPHLTRTGYQHIQSRMPSFEFDVCDIAMRSTGDFTLIPTSMQAGGDAWVLCVSRFGTLGLWGSFGRGHYAQCEHPGCPTRPSFGIEGGPATCCGIHRGEDMVDVKNRRCDHTGCTKPATFKSEGGPATNCGSRFCANHRVEGMVSTKSRPCEHTGCSTRPCYRPKDAPRDVVCGKHKRDGMVNPRLEKRKKEKKEQKQRL